MKPLQATIRTTFWTLLAGVLLVSGTALGSMWTGGEGL